jgi:hypothetical protein
VNKEKRKFVTAMIYISTFRFDYTNYICVAKEMTTPFLDTLPLLVLYYFFVLEIKTD